MMDMRVVSVRKIMSSRWRFPLDKTISDDIAIFHASCVGYGPLTKADEQRDYAAALIFQLREGTPAQKIRS
jgi:hypothetical protein